jgi:hypothetical protein
MSTLWQDCSGAIPAGGSVVILPADRNRRGLFFANPDSTHTMTVSVGNTNIPLAPGQTLALPPAGQDTNHGCPSNAISISGNVGSNYVAAHW